ncbi:MAG: hypothetical protein ACK5NT_15190, partial [Pyrinomonadaceae bacterium]
MHKFKRIVYISKDAFKLERRGEYKKALDLLIEQFQPEIKEIEGGGCEGYESAELALRIGALIGFLGHFGNMRDDQEKSRNFLMKARDEFINQKLFEKVSECENYITVTYTRTAEFREAEIWNRESLNQDIDEKSLNRAYAFLLKGLIILMSGQHSKALEYYPTVEEQIISYGDWFIKGGFASNFGLAFSYNGRYLEAIDWMERARRYHKNSNHTAYLASVENNLAGVFKRCGAFEKAHRCVDRAIALFDQIGDLSRRGISEQTKSEIYFEERDFVNAFSCAESALTFLTSNNSSVFLADAYLAKAKATLLLGNKSDSEIAFNKAFEIVLEVSGEEAAERTRREFQKANELKKNLVLAAEGNPRLLVSGKFELVVPPELSIYPGYEVVRIRNSHLSSIGVPE